uniref:Uncharacterized protein n=1 Tax=Oryza sativa subsp. japonica TaxID=39947 RepID=Q6K8C2_ORYSJ|nr:hypothetical protein [Oryza sativa Japonica Group]BAD21707.1 hypothetical protein [Oryza sativa Japonica Group]
MASFGGRSELFICSWFIASSEPGLRAHYATEAVLQPPAAGRPNLHMPIAKENAVRSWGLHRLGSVV